MIPKSSRGISIAVVVLLSLASCGGDGATQTSPRSNVPIRFQLNFMPLGDHATWLTGVEKGFYADEGLDVQVEPGENSFSTLASVAQGAADIGISDFTSMVTGRLDDPELGAVIVASLDQKARQTVFSLADGANIQRPEDLDGETLFSGVGTYGAVADAWAAERGMDVKLKEINPTTQVQLFVSERVPILLGALNVEPLYAAAAQKEGHELVTLPLAEYGLDEFYGQAVVVNESFARENPDAVRGFLEASATAFDYAFANKQEAAEILEEKYPTLLAEQTLPVIEIYEEVVTGDGTVDEFGAIDQEVVARTISVLKAGLGLKGDVDPALLYTTEYLP